MPILADVLHIASETQSRTVRLSGESLTVLFSVLDAANRLYDWQGIAKNLSPEEIDTIDRILSVARYELMTGNVGEVFMWAGNETPRNALLCNGGSYPIAEYPELYAAINGIFGGSSGNFNVPDLRSKFIYGATSLSDVGYHGGEETHTLTEYEMPAHSHSIPFQQSLITQEGVGVGRQLEIPLLTENTGITGGGQPHNNLPPYVRLAYYVVAK